MNIPLLKNTAMAIVLSDNMKSERLIIDEYSKIKRYVYSESAEDFPANLKRPKEDFIVDVKRPIGQFIRDFVPNTLFIADMFVEVNRGIFDGKLEEFYENENPIYKYVALRTLQEFHLPEGDRFYEFAQDLKCPLFDSILKGQKVYAPNPFATIISVGARSTPVEVMFMRRDMQEVAVTTADFIPLAMWYMRKIYDKGYYLQECKICKNTFLAKTATIEVLCSKKCKKKNARNLKREFDERAKEIGYEQAYKREYMYWYNRLKEFDKDSDEYKAFDDFCDEAITMKKQVKSKKILAQDFLDWMFSQRDVVDKLIGKEKAPSEKTLRKKGKELFDRLCEEYKGDEWYDDWREYSKIVLRKYADGKFDDAEFEHFIKMDTYMDDPSVAELR